MSGYQIEPHAAKHCLIFMFDLLAGRCDMKRESVWKIFAFSVNISELSEIVRILI